MDTPTNAPTSTNNPSNNLSLATKSINPNRRPKLPSWSSSAEEIAGNIDLLIQILLCLPAISLVRFRGVSRQWRYLLMGTRFPPKHVSLNPKPSISGLYYISDNYPIPLQGHPLPMLAFTGKPTRAIMGFMIHDSRHGLMLCSYGAYAETPMIIVCNPTTQKRRVFHKRGLLLRQLPHCHFYLHFDPSISLIYKLILIRNNGSEVYVCASNRSIWTTISLDTQQEWGKLLIHGFLSSDGVIYMMTEKWYLLRFDIEKEKLSASLTTHEPKMESSWKIGYFGEPADGNLVLVVAPKMGLNFMIYMMDKVEGREWVLRHHMDFTDELRKLPMLRRPILRSHFAVMRVFWDGLNEERDLTLVMGVSGKVISYNLNNKITRVICDLPGFHSFSWETTYQYVQPFVGSLCAT